MKIEEKLEKKQQEIKQSYVNCFATEDGKKVLEDLKNALCVLPEFLTENDKPEIASQIQVGLRRAYRYIYLATKTNNYDN